MTHTHTHTNACEHTDALSTPFNTSLRIQAGEKIPVIMCYHGNGADAAAFALQLPVLVREAKVRVPVYSSFWFLMLKGKYDQVCWDWMGVCMSKT